MSKIAVLMLCVAVLAGCKSSNPANPPPVRASTDTVAQTRSTQLLEIATAIQTANDATEESAGIKRLQRYLVEKGLNFTVTATRVDDGVKVNRPSESNQKLTVAVQVYDGQQPLQMVTFIPRENRNLTLLGS